MIKNAKLLAEFENNLSKNRPIDFQANLRIFDAMVQEARDLGILPVKDPLDNLPFKIRLAKALNSL